MTKSFLKGMKMPSSFWGEAVRHSVYILNMLPTRALTGRTPYEAWKKRKPNVQHIKVFGCVAHMKVPGVYTKKLDDRSKIVVYLGSEPGTKAHRLYDPKDSSVHVSPDVEFEENKSWTWELQPQNAVNTTSTFTLIGTTIDDPEENSGENIQNQLNQHLCTIVIHRVKLVKLGPHILKEVPALQVQSLEVLGTRVMDRIVDL